MISHSYHSSHDAVLPEELDPVGGGVEPGRGRQGLGAVPAAQQLLAPTSQLCAFLQLLALPWSTNMKCFVNDQ